MKVLGELLGGGANDMLAPLPGLGGHGRVGPPDPPVWGGGDAPKASELGGKSRPHCSPEFPRPC